MEVEKNIDILLVQELIAKWLRRMELNVELKDIGIVIKQWHVVDSKHCSEDVERSSVMSIAQSNTEINITRDSQIGIVLMKIAPKDFTKHKRNAVS